LQRGDPTTAERLIRDALAAKPTLRLAHFNLALLAEQRNDVKTAEREYVEELKLHPENYKSAFNLSRLYEQVGDREGQIEALKQSIVSNPRFAEGHLFLAKAYLDTESHLEEAARLAQKGIDLAPRSEYAPLGHYVLADIYNRQGRAREGALELARGRALEANTTKGERKR
jgi:tetratricopeptide (TPR) repeat protein